MSAGLAPDQTRMKNPPAGGGPGGGLGGGGSGPGQVSARIVLNAGNPDAKRLYDDLLSNYNKLVRPVVNTTDILPVRIKLKLSQLIDVVSLNLLLSKTYIEKNALRPQGTLG